MVVYFLNRYQWRDVDYVQSAEVEKETPVFYWTKSESKYRKSPDRRDKSSCFLTEQEAINKLLKNYRSSVESAKSNLLEKEKRLIEVIEWCEKRTPSMAKESSAPENTSEARLTDS